MSLSPLIDSPSPDCMTEMMRFDRQEGGMYARGGEKLSYRSYFEGRPAAMSCVDRLSGIDATGLKERELECVQ